jgi:hypothetical protein
MKQSATEFCPPPPQSIEPHLIKAASAAESRPPPPPPAASLIRSASAQSPPSGEPAAFVVYAAFKNKGSRTDMESQYEVQVELCDRKHFRDEPGKHAALVFPPQEPANSQLPLILALFSLLIQFLLC